MIQPYSYNANSSKDLLVCSEVLVFFSLFHSTLGGVWFLVTNFNLSILFHLVNLFFRSMFCMFL